MIAALLILIAGRPAHAGRRLVVLEFEGPKAERFRDDVEAALAKDHTIIALDKWTRTADDLDATKVTARNIKKVAKKLRVDGVIVGDVEKRGPRYYVHLKLREGISGDYVAEVEIVVRAAKLGSDGGKIIKQELLPAIEELERVGGRDADDDEADGRTSKRKSGFGGRDRGAKADDDDDDAPPANTKKARAEAKKKAEAKKRADAKAKADAKAEAKREAEAKKKADARSKALAKKDAEAKRKADAKRAAEDRRTARKGRDDDEEDDEDADDEDAADDEVRVASSRDDDDPIGGDADLAIGRGAAIGVDPRFPAVDLAAGMSVTARRLGFTTAPGAAGVQTYRGDPAAGVMIAADVYPLAFSKTNRSITRNLGLTVLLDRVVKIETRLGYDDMGTAAVATMPSTQQRLSAGVIYRHPVGDQLMIEASVRYNRMEFSIDRTDLPAGVVMQIPSVEYEFIDPGVAVRYLVTPAIEVGAGASFGLVLGTGDMQQPEQYGAARVLAFDVSGGASYRVTDKIVLHGDLRLTTFGFEFTGTGMLSDPEQDGMVEVPGGRDTYVGGVASVSYLF